MKKLTLSIAALLLAVMLCACGGGDGKEALKLEGNLVKLTTTEDFNNGTLENIVVDEAAGNGAIKLADGATEGVFTSAEYSITDFEYLVASWNAAIEGKGSVEIQARAYIVSHDEKVKRNDWTSYLTWGQFGPEVKRGGVSENETAEGHGDTGWAYMNEDIFSIRGVHGATKVQFKAILRRDAASDASPVLHQINGTIRNTNSGREIEATYAETPYDGELPNTVHITAPAYAQGVRDPDIGGSICSPTTISMMMNSRGEDLLPEEVALNLYDFGNGIFGSWAYAGSFPGLYGYESYVQYASLDILMQELAKGNSVGLSVKYSNEKNDSYPYLEGSYGATAGHLISIIGYEYEAGHEGDEEYLYFISGDSYSGADRSSYHRYKWTQLKEAWSNTVAYIIPHQDPDITGCIGVDRVNATLELVGDNQYALKANGQTIDLANFTSGKTSQPGHGVIGYTVEGVKTDVSTDLLDRKNSIKYDKPMQVTAHNTFFYLSSLESNLNINLSAMLMKADSSMPVGETRTITFYFISNQGVMYIAELEGTRVA